MKRISSYYYASIYIGSIYENNDFVRFDFGCGNIHIRRIVPSCTCNEATTQSQISDSELLEAIQRMNHSPLTQREMEVLQLIVKGKSNKEIADILKVSEETVKFHVKGILNKLGVTNRTQAATEALLRRIIHPEDL